MKPLLSLLCAALVAGSAATQTIQVLTTGTVPRIMNPSIGACSTSPEPYYFAISGTISGTIPPGAELRLVVRPILLNGGPIFGCEWIKQCDQTPPGANGQFTLVGQFGTNNVPRSWFAGAQAQVAVGVFSTSAPVCMPTPLQFALSLSNTTTVNTDPLLPTLFDFQIPCAGSAMNVQGTPTPGQSVTYTLPAQGSVAFGLLSTTGVLVLGCQAYFNTLVPIVFGPTDGMGVFTLPIPNNPLLAGIDLNSQGILVTGGRLDLTQPTLVQIR
ncbi:MAG: hypothetical protein IPM29_13205 [Planctomycetes bacterium]|nr:hypothetical protein [Planctomycetota bacterium]